MDKRCVVCENENVKYRCAPKKETTQEFKDKFYEIMPKGFLLCERCYEIKAYNTEVFDKHLLMYGK